MRNSGAPTSGAGASYEQAGVSIGAAEAAVDRIRDAVLSTNRPEVIGGIGAFGGAFSFPQGYSKPVLVSSTDGVGTKAYVASALARYGTIGIDLVAMCVDDLVCSGAEPLFLLDYLAVPRLSPRIAEEIVEGVAEGCRQAGCALIGGEMAEHPGSGPEGQFDLAGFAVGVVEEDRMLSSASVRGGDDLVGIASPGLRCNGYSLARHVLLEGSGRDLHGPAWEGAEATLGDELLRPSTVYVRAVMGLLADAEVHGLAHVTGGGLPGNLPRAFPEGLGAVLDPTAWRVPRIFKEVQRAGDVADNEMYRVFNMGVGMVAIVPSGKGRDAVAVLDRLGHESWVIGKVFEGRSGVEFER